MLPGFNLALKELTSYGMNANKVRHFGYLHLTLQFLHSTSSAT